METQILFINGSPRKKNNTSFLLDEAIKGAQSISGVTCKTFHFCNNAFAGCKGTCSTYCMEHGTCVTQDGFQEFMEAFLWADGLIWAAPTYHAGPPAQVKAAMDRLGNVLFSYMKGRIPRFNKACGIITHGSSRFGGQELTVETFLNSIVQLKCLPIAGDSPKSNLAVVGYAPTWEPGSILEDSAAMDASYNLGQNVALTAKLIKAGISCLKEELGERYFPDAMFEARHNANIEIDMAWQKKG